MIPNSDPKAPTGRRTPNENAQDREVEQESFARATSSIGQSKLVIATYNIRYAVGSFLISGSLLRRVGLTMPGRREGLVKRHIDEAARALTDGVRLPPPDVIGLQEADKETRRAGGNHVSRDLAARLYMNLAYAGMNVPRDEEPKSKQWYLDFEEHIAPGDIGETGIAILSRYPIVSAERLELPWSECEWRPRLALATVIETGRVSVNVFNSHIDPHASIAEQLEQHATILDGASKVDGPTVLLGDFNTLTAKSRIAMRTMLEANGYQTPFPMGTATWRAGPIRLHTDWIFVRGANVTRWGVGRPLGVSDHWPVWVEIDMKSDEQRSS